MRKQTKKLLSWVLSGALALGLVSNVNLATVSADDGTVVVDDAAWSHGGDGDARIQLYNGWGGDDQPAYLDGIKMTGVEVEFAISGVEAALNAVSTGAAIATMSVAGSVQMWGEAESANTTITEDGTYSVKFEQDEAFSIDDLLIVQFKEFNDLFANGGEDGKTHPLDNAPTFSNVKVTLTGVEEEEVVVPSGPAFYPEEVWNTDGYHAYISYQMNGSYNYRNTYAPGKEGKKATWDYATEASGDFDGTATDVLLTGDGEYTIKMEGLDLASNPANVGYFWLGIATDVDLATQTNVKITNVTLKVDGAEVAPSKDYTELNNADKNYVFAPLADHYTFDEDGVEDPWDALNEAEQMPVPSESIEITFSISGLKIGGGDVTNTPSPTPTATATATATPQATATATATAAAVKKGQTVKDTKGNSYTVSKAGKTPTVTITKVSAKTKKAKKISVPNTVKVNGVTCKVTAIGKNAYKGSKATTIVIPKNVTTIEKGAFANCKKLKTLQVKGKLKKVAKGAFKGCKKKITVKSAKKSKKANVKALKKSGYKKFK